MNLFTHTLQKRFDIKSKNQVGSNIKDSIKDSCKCIGGAKYNQRISKSDTIIVDKKCHLSKMKDLFGHAFNETPVATISSCLSAPPLKVTGFIKTNFIKTGSIETNPIKTKSVERSLVNLDDNLKDVHEWAQMVVKNDFLNKTLWEQSELKLIGSGAYGKVYLVTYVSLSDRAKSIQLAVKYDINHSCGSIQHERTVRRNISCDLVSEGLVTIIPSNDNYLLMRVYSNTLRDISIQSDEKKQIVPKIILQSLKGLKKIHDANYVHIDLHSENVLINYDKNTRNIETAISDYGCAIYHNCKQSFCTKYCWLKRKDLQDLFKCTSRIRHDMPIIFNQISNLVLIESIKIEKLIEIIELFISGKDVESIIEEIKGAEIKKKHKQQLHPYKIGTYVVAKDHQNTLYDAIVVDVEDDIVKVNFLGWDDYYDEWINAFDKDRITLVEAEQNNAFTQTNYGSQFATKCAYSIGDRISAKDHNNLWYNGEIIDENKTENRVKIHFFGFDKIWDEWISNDTNDIKTKIVYKPGDNVIIASNGIQSTIGRYLPEKDMYEINTRSRTFQLKIDSFFLSH